MRHPSNITCCYSCHATPLASEDGCVLSISSSILSPQARLTSSHLLSPLSPLHIFRQPSQYFFGICIYLPGLDRLQRRLIKFRFQNHSVRSSPPSTRLFVLRFRSAFSCSPRGKKTRSRAEGKRKKKSKHQQGSHCQTIASLLSLSVQQNYHSFSSVLRQIQKVRILNQTRSSHTPQFLLRGRD